MGDMSQTPDEQQTDPAGNGDQQQRVVVVTQDGMGIAPHREGEDGPTNPADLVEQPAKVMRIGSMIKQLLEEVRNAPLDEAGRARLAEIHRRSIKELEDGLAPELIDELERIALPFNENVPPTDAELRIAQAQLVGWLEGLFHGIQTALFAQQMAAQQQLQQIRRALPPGHAPEGGQGMEGMPGAPGLRPDTGEGGPTGQYL
ncbi:bacterial proteasome activator family protein [Pedococcus bigeumensis]|uniref:Bacterial proteasome activator n=1 Tax=Pedococcus bigeumensis TaxID=433644 RepID=A0A502CVM6_9MICO|nr:bacterial proteasome activator family protein [Pedococcus bigeumensis]